jgi:hypothetical protein
MNALSINDSTTPFIRAGRSNMVWPVIAVAVVMFSNAMTLPASTRFMVGGFLLFTTLIGIRMYVTTLARVMFLDDRIEILLALNKKEVNYDTIEHLQIVRLRLTPLLRVRIKARGNWRVIQFQIPGPITPWGSLEACRERLLQEFRAKGVQVTNE